MRHCKARRIANKWMERNLIRSFMKHGRIIITHARARLLRSRAEKVLTKVKKFFSTESLAIRREIIGSFGEKSLTSVKKFYPYFQNRDGGYTRIVKIMSRKGDGADMAIFSIVGAFNDL